LEEAVQLLLDTLRIYSPTNQEAELSAVLQERMRSMGFARVRTDRAGNTLGEVGTGKPHLLLCGHMDTVPGVLEVRQEGDRIYGRGAVDAKSPMCAMISAAASFVKKDIRVTVACVTREEGDSLGVNTLIDDGGDYDYAVFGEPGGAHKIAVGHRGRVEAKLIVKTPGGHAASSWTRPSAVDETMAALAEMRSYARKNRTNDDHYRSIDISLTMIKGGTFSNVVPNVCESTLDIRIPPGTTSEEVMEGLRAIVSSRTSGEVRMEIAFEVPTEPYETPSDSLLIRAFQRSIIKGLSAKPSMTHKTGTGDMNTLAHRLGVECVTYGPGDSRLEHTKGEFVEVSDYLDSVKVLGGVFGELKTIERGN